MLHYENKVENVKPEQSNYFHHKEVWNFCVFGLLLVCSYGNTKVNVCGWRGGGQGGATTREPPPSPP